MCFAGTIINPQYREPWIKGDRAGGIREGGKNHCYCLDGSIFSLWSLQFTSNPHF